MTSSSLHPPGASDTAPPSYEAATSTTGSSSSHRISTESPAARVSRNGITPEHRRSMEDENRPLPPGWVRQFDPVEQHQFFVDTRATPPRSIWIHPFDDEQFLSTLSPEERQKATRLHHTMTVDDLAAESSDDESHHPKLPPRPGNVGPERATSSEPAPKGIHKLGRKMKDKLTHSSHEERAHLRQQREEDERKAYIAHLQARKAMARAIETGQPQFLCKDTDGRDVYIEPPNGPMMQGQEGAYGYNPYAQGPYNDPNARFIRPMTPYNRPYGYGYGGGYGVPVAAGFLGGALLGGLLF